jgi:adenylate cyclase
MNDRWQLRIYDSGHLYVADLSGCAEIGRQQSKDEPQPSHLLSNNRWRVVIAPIDDITISRVHLSVDCLSDGGFLLCNKSNKLMVGLPNNEDLGPGDSCKVSLPIVIRLGRKMLRFQQAEEEADSGMNSLPIASPAPGSGSSLLPGMQAALRRGDGPTMDAAQLMAWLEAFLGLLQSAAGSDDFYAKAAVALVELVHLDSGRVLFHVNGQWQEKAVESVGQASSPPQSPREWKPSRSVLNNVLREKKTFWQVPDATSSTYGLDAVVAAPILDRNGTVIGALYGERQLTGSQAHEPISQLEAMLVEVLASGVAAGLARLDQERVALQSRLQMEQYFGQRLGAELFERPQLLEPKDTLVSILFCDIRGFSRITERLGAAKTVAWLSDVMGVLTQCVQERDGVVVDYVGDEVMAMWGAPKDQPDHAARACAAALAMFQALPRLNERWQPILQEPLEFGIGINSGPALTGNVGSKVRYKYGALGNTVNLASRVQGATKYLKSWLLITDATRTLAGGSFHTRRLCQVRVVNIGRPVTLFELVGDASTDWTALKVGYEEAWTLFSMGEFRQACRILGRLVIDHPKDGPALVLLARAVACLVETPDPFDPVLVLEGK